MEKVELENNQYFKNIPNHWKYYTIEEIVKNNGICYGVVQPGTQVDDGIPVIRVNNIRNGIIDKSDLLKIDPKIESKYSRSRLKGGELLLTLVGSIGEVAIVPEECVDWNVARAVGVIPVREDIGSKWVFYFLKQPIIQDLIKNWATTTVQVTFNLKELAKLPILIPPKPEKEAIAHILGTLDDKIELNRRMNETLESIARAIFTSWFIDFDPVRAKAEGRQPEGMDAATAALFPSEFETVEGQEIPKGWQVKPFIDIIEIFGGGTPKTSNPDYWNGNIPWFSVVDSPSVHDVWVIDTEKKITEDGLNNSSTRLLTVGTTIITARGTVGNLALVGNPMTMNQSCYGLKPKSDIGPYFSYYQIRSLIDELKQNTHGSVFDTITRDTFSHFSIIIPNKKICSKYEEITNLILGKMKQNLIESKNLSSIRDTLLPKLLSGELPITNPEQFTGVS